MRLHASSNSEYERFEQCAKKRFAATAGNRGESRLERQLGRGEFWLPLTSTPERRVEPARKHNGEQRRCDVRPVVDVLVLRAALAAAPTNHSDRIDIEDNGRRTRFLARLRVEDHAIAERELSRVHMLWMLVQQESEVGRRPVSHSDRQEHLLIEPPYV